MRVVVQLFGFLAEQAGRPRLDVSVDRGTVEAVVEAAAREGRLRIDPSVRYAVNTDYATPDAPVREGDVVSLLPPVGGG